MLAKRSGTKCNHQPVHADCMAHQCSADPSRNGKGLFLAKAVEQPCSQQVSPSAGSVRWALENERDGNKGVHDWISRWGIFCIWCHAAATADNICQGKRADRGSVNHDNPNNVFKRKANTKPNGTSVEHYQRYWTHYNANVFILLFTCDNNDIAAKTIPMIASIDNSS